MRNTKESPAADRGMTRDRFDESLFLEKTGSSGGGLATTGDENKKANSKVVDDALGTIPIGENSYTLVSKICKAPSSPFSGNKKH